MKDDQRLSKNNKYHDKTKEADIQIRLCDNPKTNSPMKNQYPMPPQLVLITE